MDAAVMTTEQPTDRSQVTERFAQIALAQLEESPHNPRTHFDQAKLLELGESIQQKGIIEPLVVRERDPLGPGLQFEIVAGARRFRAATMAGLHSVPCIVRDYSDEDVLEIFVIENIQRDDLSPLEQARGFKQLLTVNADRFSVATIAGKVGMSPAWVWDRIKLLDLVPEAQALLEQGRITVGHAIVLARLKPADQERAIDVDGGLWDRSSARSLFEFGEDMVVLDDPPKSDDPYEGYKTASIRELETWVEDHVRFDVAHAAKAQPLVYEDLAGAVDDAAARPGRGKKVIAITFEHVVRPEAKDESDRTYGPKSWRLADGSEGFPTCEHGVLGVVVAGPRQGKSFQVCIARDTCRVHFAAEIKAKEKAAKARAIGDTKTAAKVEKKQEQSWERQQRERREQLAIWTPMKPHVLGAALDQVKGVTAITPSQAKHFEQQREFYINTDTAARVLGKRWFENLAAAALVTDVENSFCESFDQFVKEVAAPLGLDMKPLLAARDAHSPKPAAAAAPTTKPAKKGKGRK